MNVYVKSDTMNAVENVPDDPKGPEGLKLTPIVSFPVPMKFWMSRVGIDWVDLV